MQTKLQSLIEAVFGTIVGFGIAWIANWGLWRIFDLHPSVTQSFWMTVFFTLISLVRVYAVRRLFARWHRV